jgi:hypothetical protein
VDQCEKENGFGHDAIVDDKIMEGMNPAKLQMQFNDSERNMV